MITFLLLVKYEAVYCFILGRLRVAVARYRMICLVLTFLKGFSSKIWVFQDMKRMYEVNTVLNDIHIYFISFKTI